jgi:uncharacterized protein YecT (DUF1311 family)
MRPAALAFLLALPLAAQVKVDPIDKTLGDCLGNAENQTTAGMVDCYGKAIQAADKALNRTWQRLMKALPPAEQAALKDSQKAWLKFRDEERKALGLLAGREGTLHRLQAASAHLKMVQERIAQLERFFEEGD